ncbi:hypothetical protein PRIPAC_85844 [Pristionchus pacificus]|uniref:PDZ domain-containing protein n=1 Tax=Pristionchus pacificus TaxID=54126 RepID=A0A2A6BRX0_PRIPA|nr:hypothetical protein PRIPAC_85844 [Pristionchus pacificus]|eukprot:PDM68650.1 PDZ domain-containing protein [Pristionchus pacificus]
MAAVFELASDDEYEIVDMPPSDASLPYGGCSCCRGRNARCRAAQERRVKEKAREIPFDIYNPHSLPRTVQVKKVNGQVGLRRAGNYVEEVVPGSAADLAGGIFPGDRLISVDGVNVEKLCSEDISRLLGSFSNVVTIVVRFDERRAVAMKNRKKGAEGCSIM